MPFGKAMSSATWRTVPSGATWETPPGRNASPAIGLKPGPLT